MDEPGWDREAVSLALTALATHLTLYDRSLAASARAISDRGGQ